MFSGSEIPIVILTSVLIFFARIVDVSIGTMRIIFVAKGRKYLAPLLGFFEILIWLVAIRWVIQASSNPFYFVAYAAGFSMGNFVGILLEGKLALGTLVVRIITQKDAAGLLKHLSSMDFGVTSIDAQGKHGDVKMIYTIIKRKDLKKVVAIINKHNPKAFYSIAEAQSSYEGVFPMVSIGKGRRFFDFTRMSRKAK